MLLEKPKKSDFWIFIGKLVYIYLLIVAFCYFVSHAGPGTNSVLDGCRSITSAISPD